MLMLCSKKQGINRMAAMRISSKLLIIAGSIILVSFSCGSPDPSATERQPNILLFVADDLGYGDLGCYGAEDIRTPNIDNLAKQGVRLTHFYANAPECTPTRTALLTGRYQQRVGGLECAIGAGNVGRYDEAIWLWERKELGLPVEESTLMNSLKAAGYQTAMLGKWHLGYEQKFRPDRHGFDYSFGNIGYGGDYFYHVEQEDIGLEDFTGAHNLAENGKEVFYDRHYMTHLITDKAIAWLGTLDRRAPFFLYLPYTAPHTPFQGPGDDPGRPIEGEEWTRGSRAKFIEMVEALDGGVGKILGYLSENAIEKETIVIFFSDNGGRAREADNGIFSGAKGQVYEGGIHVPCIIRWPGKIPEGSVSAQMAISFDLTRSIIDLSGVISSDLKLDGYDIIAHITGKKQDFARTLYWRKKRAGRVHKAINDGDFKYLIVKNNGVVEDEKLFRLTVDPAEKNDLLTAMPEKAGELKEKLADWETEVTAPRLGDFTRK
jgi:N-acetylgalactosamine-6-sulfatase